MRWVRTVVLVAGQAAPGFEVLRKGWERSLLDPSGLEDDLQWLPGEWRRPPHVARTRRVRPLRRHPAVHAPTLNAWLAGSFGCEKCGFELIDDPDGVCLLY